ncbi:hypothetical protein Cgig2_001271 [Carnegiea gigantea]|uniref:Transposase MuDR plant domain-containing protein n=1 Tax=Carnegiea gigantea TaxID=171969 RepID=A0A9Q1GU23_9CARY|nr:hypothetical protein Cgig2_001271 [Carnegiea gigantea]
MCRSTEMAMKILHIKFKGETIDLGDCHPDEMSALDVHNITKCKMREKGKFPRFPAFYYCKPGQREKLVEDIELSEPNPEESEEGEDEGSDYAEDVVVVSPTKALKETMDVDMKTVIEELVVSLEDIDEFILSQSKCSQGEIVDYYICGDDDENDNSINPNEKMYAGHMWEPNLNEEVSIRQWDMFINKARCMKVVRDCCVQEGKNLMKLKNVGTRYIVKCAHKSCLWKLHTSTLPDGRTFQVKTYFGKHDNRCPRLMDNPMASSRWISEKLPEDFRQNPKLKFMDIRNMLLHRYGLMLKDHVIRRARKLILYKTEGRHD